MKIVYSSKFARSFRKLPIVIQKEALQTEEKFRLDPFDPTLRTHKLSGKLKGFYSFSIDYSHRILFQFLEDETILFLNVGDHDIYR